MKGLLIKEYYSLMEMSNFKFTMFAGLGCLILGAIGAMPFMLFFIPICMSMMPRSVMAFDENSKWQQFSLALPYSRRDIVSAKYLSTFFVVAAFTLLSGAAYTVSSVIRGEFHVSELAFITLIGCSVGLILPSLIMPFDMKFGTANAKMVTLILGGLLGCGGGIAANLLGRDNIAKLSSSLSTAYLPYILAGAAVVIYALSWVISVKLYESREF